MLAQSPLSTLQPSLRYPQLSVPHPANVHILVTHTLLTGLTSDNPAALMMPYLLAMSTWHSQAQVHMCFVVPVFMIFVGGRSHLFQTSVLIQHSSVESMSPPMGHSKLFLCTPGKAHLV